MVQVQAQLGRFRYPTALAEYIGSAAAEHGGCQFPVASETQPGSGELVLYGYAEGDELVGAIRAALCWVKLHSGGLRQLFRARPVVDLRSLDYDLHVDMGYYEIRKSGCSVRAWVCPCVNAHPLMQQRWSASLSCIGRVLLAASVGGAGGGVLAGATGDGRGRGEAGGANGRRVSKRPADRGGGAAEEEDIELVVLPRENYDEARAILERHGWSGQVQLVPVTDMGEVLRLVFLRSVRDRSGG